MSASAMISRHGALVTVYRPTFGKTGAAAIPTGWATVVAGFKMMFGTMTQERQLQVFGLTVDDGVTGAYPYTVTGLAPEDRLTVTTGDFSGQTYRVVALRTHSGPLSVQHREALMIGSTEVFP